jgi:2-dehydro-3-deoxyphosphogluconate aldolase/(4S)-4-hydroxy-2-oxoglutarate aldolase
MPGISKSDFLDSFRENPFLGIARGLPPEQAIACAECCVRAKLKFIEVPLNTENATAALKNLCEEGEKRDLLVGAGTVLTGHDLQIALDCGAKFIVTPGTNHDAVQKCVEKNIPCISGALTPTEIMQAHFMGATVIKVFPVSALGGPQYLKELRGPFKNIPLLACGGVKAENVLDFFKAGCDFVSFGASVFSISDMENGNWQKINHLISLICSSVSTG